MELREKISTVKSSWAECSSRKTHVVYPTKLALQPLELPPAEPEEPIIFNLAARGYHLPPLQHDEGSDIGEIIDLTDNENDSDMEGDIDKKLTQLWRQFLVDVTAKVSNRKGAFAPSYCILSKFERDNVNQKTYQNLNLRAYFDNCQYRTATRHDWNAAFDKCWPLPGDATHSEDAKLPKDEVLRRVGFIDQQ